jgi:hypothetical protein
VKRTTVMLPEELDARLRTEARRRGVTVAELVREAVQARFGQARKRRLSFVAVGDGGPPHDTSERIEELYAEALERDYLDGQRADR